MAVSAIKTSSKLQLVQKKWKHGMLLHAFKNKLKDIGLNINPFYYVQEGLGDLQEPKIKGNPSEYTVSYFGPEEIKIINEDRNNGPLEEMLRNLEEGQLCIGLKHKGRPVAQMLAKPGLIQFGNKHIHLESHEIFLSNMYTIKAYRGKRLAPFLRYHSFLFLREQGFTQWYSISEAFNKATIRFKQKLNSEHKALWLELGFFNRKSWFLKLRNF